MNVLQHTSNERNPCLKQNRQDRSYRDTLLNVKEIALKSNSSGVNNVNEAPSSSAGANVNNVNKADDGFVNVTRSSSRSVVPTAAVLAAELLKRTTPPSVVGVPKCRKKL